MRELVKEEADDLLGCDFPSSGSAGIDGGILQLRLYRVDILQLVFSVHGAGAGVQSSIERIFCDAAVSVDDGVLSGGGSAERQTDGAVWIASREVQAGGRVDGGDGAVSGDWLAGGEPATGGVDSGGRSGRLYISQSSFWSVSVDIAGDNSGIFSSIMNMGDRSEERSPFADSLDCSALWLDDFLCHCSCACTVQRCLLADCTSGTSSRRGISNIAVCRFTRVFKLAAVRRLEAGGFRWALNWLS